MTYLEDFKTTNNVFNVELIPISHSTFQIAQIPASRLTVNDLCATHPPHTQSPYSTPLHCNIRVHIQTTSPLLLFSRYMRVCGNSHDSLQCHHTRNSLYTLLFDRTCLKVFHIKQIFHIIK